MTTNTTDTRPDATNEPAQPLLKVANPDATPEEIATIIAILTALGDTPPPAEKPHTEWGAPHRHHRHPHHHGPGGWRASALP